MNRYRMLLIIAFLASGTSMTQAASDKPAKERLDSSDVVWSRYAKAYIGQDNVTVEVAHYKRGSKEGAILLFKGLESPWDGQAIHHRVRVGTYGRKEYVTTYEGKDWVSFIVDQKQGDKASCTLYAPGYRDGLALTPSDGAAQLTTPKAIHQTYLDQLINQKGEAE